MASGRQYSLRVKVSRALKPQAGREKGAQWPDGRGWPKGLTDKTARVFHAMLEYANVKDPAAPFFAPVADLQQMAGDVDRKTIERHQDLLVAAQMIRQVTNAAPGTCASYELRDPADWRDLEPWDVAMILTPGERGRERAAALRAKAGVAETAEPEPAAAQPTPTEANKPPRAGRSVGTRPHVPAAGKGLTYANVGSRTRQRG